MEGKNGGKGRRGREVSCYWTAVRKQEDAGN